MVSDIMEELHEGNITRSWNIDHSNVRDMPLNPLMHTRTFFVRRETKYQLFFRSIRQKDKRQSWSAPIRSIEGYLRTRLPTFQSNPGLNSLCRIRGRKHHIPHTMIPSITAIAAVSAIMSAEHISSAERSALSKRTRNVCRSKRQHPLKVLEHTTRFRGLLRIRQNASASINRYSRTMA